MKAITVEPKKPGTVRYEDIPEPDSDSGPEEQCGGRQRECEQAALVQSEFAAGANGPQVAEPPDYPL